MRLQIVQYRLGVARVDYQGLLPVRKQPNVIVDKSGQRI